MPYKSIVAILRGQADTKHLLECVTPVVRAFDAHITGLHAEPSPAAYVSVVAGDMVTWDQAAMEAGSKRMEAVKTAFETHCSREGLSHEWRGLESFSGDSATASRTTALAADLVVAQQSNPDEVDDIFADLETLLFDSGRPILFVPYINCPPVAPKNVVIAWKATKEAARATFDALPFLHRAEKVTILVVDPRESEEHSAQMSASDIAATLSRHGIKVSIENQPSGGIPVGDAIANHVLEAGADLLVMGGYSRSPIREMLFGGATRTMLRSMAVPVLMTH